MKQRDRHSIELKFRYMLDSERADRRSTYDVNVYFFFPYSFNMNSGSYDRNEYNDDLKLYLRFNTPTLKVRELLDKGSRISPLRGFERMVRAADSRVTQHVLMIDEHLSPPDREVRVQPVQTAAKQWRGEARALHLPRHCQGDPVPGARRTPHRHPRQA